MASEELIKERSMRYLELCDYLKNKYGLVNGSYFVNESCKTKNQKIKRTNEGLFIHHIYENKVVMLSHEEYAIKFPFEYQYGENLVYCNYLEHLLLHVAIVKEYLKKQYVEKTKMAVGIGGLINYIIPEIIDYINGYEYKKEYMIKALSVIDGNELFFINTVIDLREYMMNHEFTVKVASELSGGNLLQFRRSFFQGKMTIRQSEKLRSLLYEHEVVFGKIELITSQKAEEIIKQIIEKPGYDYWFTNGYNGKYKNLHIHFRNAKNEIINLDYALLKDDEFDIEGLYKKYFDTVIYGNGATAYIRKNATVQCKKAKSKKNSKKDHYLVIDGITVDWKSYTKESAERIVKLNKK